MRENDLSKFNRFWVRFLKKFVLAIRGFFKDDLMYRASVLTYYSLLAIVPIIAIFIAIARGFGLQNDIENFIYSLLGSDHEITPYIMEFVNNYLTQAQGGLFVGIGIIILLWSVVSMFRQVEHNFNKIWNIKDNRAFLMQFITYLAVLILIPIFAVSATSVSNLIDSYISAFGETTVGSWFMPIYHFFLKLVPYIIYWLLFSILFYIIPNTKVRVVDALFAGIITGTAFIILKYVYISGQVNLSKYNAVYGSFAAIPLLLFWLQISWLITLFGAELAYVSQNLMSYNFDNETKNISRRYKDYTLIIVLKIIIKRFERGESPISAYGISTKYNIPLRIVEDHLQTLKEVELINEVNTSEKLLRHYQPSMDINQISLRFVMERIENFGSEDFKILYAEEFETTWNALKKIKTDYSIHNNVVLIKDL